MSRPFPPRRFTIRSRVNRRGRRVWHVHDDTRPYLVTTCSSWHEVAEAVRKLDD